MRSNPSCRYFTDDHVDDTILHRIFDHARFASSGGNRQGWRTIVVTDPELKQKIADLHAKQWNVYLDQAREGVVGYQTTDTQTKMDSYNPAQHRLTRTDDFAKSLANAPALLVCCVELWTLAVTDKDLDRQSIVGGGSLYTFVQNVLLGCRNEGLGSALTTLLAAEEAAVAESTRPARRGCGRSARRRRLARPREAVHQAQPQTSRGGRLPQSIRLAFRSLQSGCWHRTFTSMIRR